MSTLCFGTFFTLLCGNKKDWDKKRKPEVSNRVLYFALLDIIGKNDNNPHHHAEKATTGEVSGYKNDIVSDAKNCRRDEHPIQRTWNVTRYIERFTQEHTVVLADFVEFITKYLDEQQRERLALSVIELIKNSGLNDNVAFHIGDNATAFFEKKKIKDEKRDYNLPSILAGVMYYIIKNDIPNGSAEAQGTIDDWKTTYTDAPYCPCGETLDEEYKINLICIVPEPLNEKEPARNEADNNTHKLPRDNMDSQTTPESNHGRNQSRAIPDTQTHLYEQQLGEEYYNLIVHWAYEPEDCWLNKDRVVMSRDRVIEGYVSDEIYAMFGDVSDEATIERIKQLPTIFACESSLNEYPEQVAYYGFVTDIKVRDNGINIYFRKVGQLSQRKLLGIAYNLAIKTNEFTHTHWTIKKVNLIEELNDADLMDNLKVRFKPETKSGKIVMSQYGNNGQQIGEISGGNITFTFGGNSSHAAKEQNKNSTDAMIELFRKAIVDFKIVRFIKADPTVNLPADLPTCVDGFVEYIEDEVIQTFIHCQRNLTYKKIREFNKTIDSYNAYLSTHMRPPNSDATSIFVPLFREENYEWAAEFEDETIKQRKMINGIYGEILDGETLFV